MTTIPIPEKATGRVGMVAALKRVSESNIGKLVVLREPAGMVTSLVGSDKPVFAWLAQVLGEPIDCHGKPSRSLYVADPSLIPISTMTPDEIEIIARAQAKSDFDAALDEFKVLIKRNAISNEELEHFVNKASAQVSIERALEIVPVPVALREIGFYSSPESKDSLVWVGLHDGLELKFFAGEQWIFQWVIVGTGNTPRDAIWDERNLPSQAPRGKVVSTVRSIWRDAFAHSKTPECFYLGEIFERHQAELRSLDLGLPHLSVAPRVFKAILKWLRPKYGFASPDSLVQLTYDKGLLRFDLDGTAFGCPAGGQWVDECKILLTELVDLYEKIMRTSIIRLERADKIVLVNGYPLRIQP